MMVVNEEILADRKRRDNEWRALLEISKTSLLRCHRCPIWSLCRYQKAELSRTIQFNIDLQKTIPYQPEIDELKDGLKRMRNVKSVCPILKKVEPWIASTADTKEY